MNNDIWKMEPTPLLDRNKQFSQGEAMEHFLSGADPAPEIIPGLLSQCRSAISECRNDMIEYHG